MCVILTGLRNSGIVANMSSATTGIMEGRQPRGGPVNTRYTRIMKSDANMLSANLTLWLQLALELSH